jgi:hypothetical protein
MVLPCEHIFWSETARNISHCVINKTQMFYLKGGCLFITSKPILDQCVYILLSGALVHQPIVLELVYFKARLPEITDNHHASRKQLLGRYPNTIATSLQADAQMRGPFPCSSTGFVLQAAYGHSSIVFLVILFQITLIGAPSSY